MTVTLKTFAGRATWLRARQKCIGSSDAPGVLGVSEWGLTPLKVWLRKVAPPPAPEEVAAEEEAKPWLSWGRRLEPEIAKAFHEKTGRRVVLPSKHFGGRSSSHHIAFNPERPWQGASLDRIQYDGKRPGVLELKTAFDDAGWIGDEPPLDYQVQVQHQFAVTGLEWGDIAVLVRGSHFLTAHIERNDAFIAKMNRIEEAFWQMVLDNRPPPPAPLDSEALSQLFPHEAPGSTAHLMAETYDSPLSGPVHVDPYDQLRRRHFLLALRRQIGDQIEGCDAMLKALMGNVERGLLPDGCYVSWKTQQTTRAKDVACPQCQHVFDFGVSTSRVFKTHMPKHLAEAMLPTVDMPTLVDKTLSLTEGTPQEKTDDQ